MERKEVVHLELVKGLSSVVTLYEGGTWLESGVG